VYIILYIRYYSLTLDLDINYYITLANAHFSGQSKYSLGVIFIWINNFN